MYTPDLSESNQKGTFRRKTAKFAPAGVAEELPLSDLADFFDGR
jgi:hypothetical protein